MGKFANLEPCRLYLPVSGKWAKKGRQKKDLFVWRQMSATTDLRSESGNIGTFLLISLIHRLPKVTLRLDKQGQIFAECLSLLSHSIWWTNGKRAKLLRACTVSVLTTLSHSAHRDSYKRGASSLPYSNCIHGSEERSPLLPIIPFPISLRINK